MPGRLDGKTALITGATSGIGAATARLFLAEGANVVVTGRNESRGLEVTDGFGSRGRFVQTDVRVERDIAKAVEATVEAYGGLDILFNNAGGPTYGDVETVTVEQYRDAVDLLLGSVIFGMKHAAPVMKVKGRGAIINNSSVAALRCHMGGYLYSAAKAAVTHVTRLAGMELGRHGVTVNSISPGGIVTPIFLGGSDQADGLADQERDLRLKEVGASIDKGTPMLTRGSPEAIAHAALYLASEAGRFVNCHDLVVDAGIVAGGKTRYAR